MSFYDLTLLLPLQSQCINRTFLQQQKCDNIKIIFGSRSYNLKLLAYGK